MPFLEQSLVPTCQASPEPPLLFPCCLCLDSTPTSSHSPRPGSGGGPLPTPTVLACVLVVACPQEPLLCTSFSRGWAPQEGRTP